ncbi:hypothetical protein [Kocuria sp. KH4]
MTQPPSDPGHQGPDYGQQPGPYQGQPGQYQSHPGQYQGQPGQYPPGYGQPPKKSGKKKWAIGCGILTLLAILLFGGCAALGIGAASQSGTTTPGATTDDAATDDAGDAADDAEPSAVQTEEVTDAGTVTLEATASTTGTALWMDLDGSSNTEEFTGTWSKEIPLKDGNETYTLSVTGDFMDENSEVTCKLYVDGELKDEATGTGSAGSASCSQPLFG